MLKSANIISKNLLFNDKIDDRKNTMNSIMNVVF
jgi:hypothetical protein